LITTTFEENGPLSPFLVVLVVLIIFVKVTLVLVVVVLAKPKLITTCLTCQKTFGAPPMIGNMFFIHAAAIVATKLFVSFQLSKCSAVADPIIASLCKNKS